MDKLNFYKVNEEYIKYIRKFDEKVSQSYNEKARRPFIGIILNVDGILYFAPFTSPKKKHLKMKNTIDFLKIDNGNLGAINFNNMIPIPLEQCIKIDVDNETDKKYEILLHKQIKWCNKKMNRVIIFHKANNLYNKVITKTIPQRILERCCDFKLLEEKYKEFLAKK